MDAKLIETLGDELYHAMSTQTVVEPLTTRHPGITIAHAYHIQQRMLSRRLQGGERVVGKKIVSRRRMNMLGVYQPDFGYLLDGMIYNEGQSIDPSTLIQPKAEGEIAFILKKDLMGPGISNADVLAATECVMPCFEIVDSRIRDWKIKIQDTVADNASCGVFVLGDCAVDPRHIDLSTCGMVLEKKAKSSHRRRCRRLGLAGECRRLAGQHARDSARPQSRQSLSGALAAMSPAKAGDNFRVSIGGMGSCSVRFH
jgi:2-oxopent-4-enoate/cis-2-oxohex-4-enoate hydratase